MKHKIQEMHIGGILFLISILYYQSHNFMQWGPYHKQVLKESMSVPIRNMFGSNAYQRHEWPMEKHLHFLGEMNTCDSTRRYKCMSMLNKFIEFWETIIRQS